MRSLRCSQQAEFLETCKMRQEDIERLMTGIERAMNGAKEFLLDPVKFCWTRNTFTWILRRKKFIYAVCRFTKEI